MDYMVKGGLNRMFWCLGVPWTRDGSVWGCLSVVNTAASAIFTEGAWMSGWRFKLVWPAASEEAIKLLWVERNRTRARFLNVALSERWQEECGGRTGIR